MHHLPMYLLHSHVMMQRQQALQQIRPQGPHPLVHPLCDILMLLSQALLHVVHPM